MNSRAAVFLGPNRPLELREFPVADPQPGDMVVRVRMATICGSDLHTVTGRRGGDVPSILGHEITGEVARLGTGIRHDASGAPLREGDRVTWSIAASCGHCAYCRDYDLPQKCDTLFKYGHAPCDAPPYLNGGYADYVYVRQDTTVLRVPDAVSDEEVTPINCALATVMNGVDLLDVRAGDSVVVQGAGMLGLYACAVLRERGCAHVIAVDLDSNRLDAAARFGATLCLLLPALGDDGVRRLVMEATHGRGADAVLEVSGAAASVPPGLDLLRIGGRYVSLGLVVPNAIVSLDMERIVKRILTVRGLHNYHPRSLRAALDFVAAHRTHYPFGGLVGQRFPLSDINAAIIAAHDRRNVRVAIVPAQD